MDQAQDLSNAPVNLKDIDEVFSSDGLSSPHVLVKNGLAGYESRRRIQRQTSFLGAFQRKILLLTPTLLGQSGLQRLDHKLS